MDELRDHRSKEHQRRERESLREMHGDVLAAALSLAAGSKLSREDFKMDASLPFPISWSRRLEDSSGLVAAYIEKEDANRIALCIENSLSQFEGSIGVYGNSYLGLCDVSRVSISGLVEAAEDVNDAVVFYPKNVDGAVLVDFYSSNPGPPFSLLVQGSALVDQLKGCF